MQQLEPDEVSQVEYLQPPNNNNIHLSRQEGEPNLKLENKMSSGRLRVNDTKVKESYVVAIPTSIMKGLDISEGEFVLLQSGNGKETVCLVTEDKDINGEIRLNPITRKNLDVAVEDFVMILPCPNIKMANKIRVALCETSSELPVTNLEELQEFIIEFFRREKTVPVHEGDIFALENKDGGDPVEFKIVYSDPPQYCLVIPSTEICLESECCNEDLKYQNVTKSCNDLDKIKTFVKLRLYADDVLSSQGIALLKGVIICGSSGTGKSLFAETLCNDVRALIPQTIQPKIIGEISENSLKSTFEMALKNAPCAIVLDHLDALAPIRDSRMENAEKKMGSDLITLIDKLDKDSKVVIIGTTSRLHAIDPALRCPERLGFACEIGLPDMSGRRKLLQTFTKKMKISNDVDLEVLAVETCGFTGADLESLCTEAAHQKLNELSLYEKENLTIEELEDSTVDMHNFCQAIKNFWKCKSPTYVVETPQVSWEEIVGLSEVKTQLTDIIQYWDHYLSHGCVNPKGILFHGPRGCGKTLLAQAMATAWNAKFICISCAELLLKRYEPTSVNIAHIFEHAREMSPCVLYVDDIDMIAQKASTGTGKQDTFASNILTQLFYEVGANQDEKILVIGSTTRADMIEPTILQPDKLSELFYVPFPDRRARRELFQRIINECSLQFGISEDVNEEYLANNTCGFSVRDINTVCQRACRLAIADSVKRNEAPMESIENLPRKGFEKMQTEENGIVLDNNHFLTVLDRVQSFVSEDDVTFYDKIADTLNPKKITDDDYDVIS